MKLLSASVLAVFIVRSTTDARRRASQRSAARLAHLLRPERSVGVPDEIAERDFETERVMATREPPVSSADDGVAIGLDLDTVGEFVTAGTGDLATGDAGDLALSDIADRTTGGAGHAVLGRFSRPLSGSSSPAGSALQIFGYSIDAAARRKKYLNHPLRAQGPDSDGPRLTAALSWSASGRA